MDSKRERDRSQETGKTRTSDAQDHQRKRTKSNKSVTKELGTETCKSRSVSINGDDSVIKTSEMRADTPKSKVIKTRKCASTSAKKLVPELNNPSRQSSSIVKHGPNKLRRSVGSTPSRETPQEQSLESEQRPDDVTPSKKRKVSRFAKSKAESSKKEPLKKKARRKSEAHVESADVDDGLAEDPRGVGCNELVGRCTLASPNCFHDEEDEIIDTTETVEPNILASPVLMDTTNAKGKKSVVRRVRKYQPWNVNKHVIMSRGLLREARNIDLDPRILQTLRQRLDIQKKTKAAFAEAIKDTGYSWSPPTSWDAAAGNATCNEVVDLAHRISISSDARKAMLDSMEGYRKFQCLILREEQVALSQEKRVQPDINQLLSAARTIKIHVNLAQETLRNSTKQGRNIKVKHIHSERWELHSKDYIKTRFKLPETREWEVPTLIFQRNDCQLENGERKHRCYVAGLLIGGEEFETHCLQIPKHASLEPVIAPTQAGRYVEGEEDTCHIKMMFLGHGCMSLQLPKLLLDQNIGGKCGPKSKAILDFYAVQVARGENSVGD
jgi:hypothetical protein